jgi:hypothetical protein
VTPMAVVVPRLRSASAMHLYSDVRFLVPSQRVVLQAWRVTLLGHPERARPAAAAGNATAPRIP